MPSPSLSSPDRLAGTPAVRERGCWWLIAPTGAVPADTALAHDLDRHGADLAAANHAVAVMDQQ
ncbi:hypothetical protein C3486_00215 [Streptomyces sp. Ru73]|nr:hypothetical protein C3486_00215 [Streptomyces sp. Ru73]